MRINKYLAGATSMSRRAADKIVERGEVSINGQRARQGSEVNSGDIVLLNGKQISLQPAQTIMLNKPAGYVCSRESQGHKTIYELLPARLHHLKPVGRLDMDSSGLLLLTNDGDLANELTHPSQQKKKVYEIEIDKPLSKMDFDAITERGVDIGDGKPSRFQLEIIKEKLDKDESSSLQFPDSNFWLATLAEGRNRQIRRTFEALGRQIKSLHRVQFGPYKLGTLKLGEYSTDV